MNKQGDAVQTHTVNHVSKLHVAGRVALVVLVRVALRGGVRVRGQGCVVVVVCEQADSHQGLLVVVLQPQNALVLELPQLLVPYQKVHELIPLALAALLVVLFLLVYMVHWVYMVGAILLLLLLFSIVFVLFTLIVV